MIQTLNPSTEEILTTYEEDSETDVNRKLRAAEDAGKEWRLLNWEKRLSLLKRVSDRLSGSKELAAQLMAQEMGKPLMEARSEIEKCRSLIDYYAKVWPEGVGDESILSSSPKVYVHHEPLGVILGIMPWNFPFWQVFRFAIPTLLMGNTVLLKHSSNTTGSALFIEDSFHQAGLPDGVFQVLKVGHQQIERILRSGNVAAVSLTGSTSAGKKIAAVAGEVLKKCVLELGGSDPYLILADADIERAAKICAQARLINNGQSCVSAKRFIVDKKVVSEFSDELVREMGKRAFGPPLLEKSDQGPMARGDLREELHEQVQKSVKMGAKTLIGGEIPEGKGFFYPPTVLINVTQEMPAFREELFGPVAAVISFETEEEGLRLANQTVYGLGSGVFSSDLKKAEKLAREGLKAGMSFVNDFVRSDPRWPFGGIKESGYGRELGKQGLLEFVNSKTIYVSGV